MILCVHYVNINKIRIRMDNEENRETATISNKITMERL
jgi:hypothetical protein